MIRIENWSVVSNHDGYTPPECEHKYLQGNVYGHPRFKNGHPIMTSSLVMIDVEARVAETYSGSKYSLGEVDPEYWKWFQNTRLV